MPEAVVLLHAFPMDSRMWRPQVGGLSGRRWQVVTPELDFTRHPTMDAMADSVAATIAALGIGPVVLGGLSMGGYVAFAVVRRHPELVRALVLADTRAGPDTDELRERRTSQQARVAEAGSAAPVVEAMLAALPGEYTRTNRPDAMATIAVIMGDATPAGVIAALEAMKHRPDSTPDLPGIVVPALVIVGDQDTVTPPAVAEEMSHDLPDGRLAVIPRAGHLSNLEEPGTFNAELRGFLASLGT